MEYVVPKQFITKYLATLHSTKPLIMAQDKFDQVLLIEKNWNLLKEI